MNKKKHIKLWVIEKYNQYSKERKLLAILNSRLNYDKVIFAMKILMMGDSTSYSEILNVHLYKKNELEYPHQYLKYPIIIAGNSQYYKAPYRAWIADFNRESGKYTDIEISLKKYQEQHISINQSPSHS